MRNRVLIFLLLLTNLALGQITPAIHPDSLPPPFPCPFKFNLIKGADTMILRYASNYPIKEKNDNIKRLVIVIHGVGRNGLDYYEWCQDAINAEGKNDETLIVSPQFPSDRDMLLYKHNHNHLFWFKNEWRSGDNSADNFHGHSIKKKINSFSLIDSLIMRVANTQLFPNLKKITIIGHSAGGQFVQRYAGMTPVPNNLKNFAFRFIIMNPSSYLYFDNRRPEKVGDKIQFVTPKSTDCADYNIYPKGLEKPNAYLRAVGIELMKSQFLARDIYFVMGGSDIDPDQINLDKTCGANLQGHFRLERAEFYYQYLQTFATDKKPIHHFHIVPNVAHEGGRMLFDPNTRRFMLF